MILKWTEYIIWVINYYLYILFFSPQRAEERIRESGVTMHCDEVHVTVFCDMWYVNKCCLKLLISGSSLFLFIKPPLALLMCFSPTHASLAQWSGWNYPQYNWGIYWLHNCYISILFYLTKLSLVVNMWSFNRTENLYNQPRTLLLLTEFFPSFWVASKANSYITKEEASLYNSVYIILHIFCIKSNFIKFCLLFNQYIYNNKG